MFSFIARVYSTVRVKLHMRRTMQLLLLLILGLSIVVGDVRWWEIGIWLVLLLAVVWRFNSITVAPPNEDEQQVSASSAVASRELSSPLYEMDRIQKWFDLKRIEYDKAAERYDNIYRAIWQNFSYMAVLAGGILTFGTKDLDRALAYFLTLTPLAFWYQATFLPMDHYGDQTRERLSSIEDEINGIYFPKPSDPRLQHFKSFKRSKYKWRVQDAVNYFGVAISAVWLLMAVLAVHHAVDPKTGSKAPPSRQAVQLEPQPFQLEMRDPSLAAVSDSLALLSRRMHAVDSILRCPLVITGRRGRFACTP
jgi:Ca2+/Na+ antiporter